MTTAEENQSKEVLPPEPMRESEKDLPTQIHNIDEDIKWIDTEIDNLSCRRAGLSLERKEKIARALEITCVDAGSWKIVQVPVYPKSRVDVEYLKKNYEDRYKQIIANISLKITDKAKAEALKAETFISQADVKSVISDKGILALVIPRPTEPDHYNIEVVKRT